MMYASMEPSPRGPPARKAGLGTDKLLFGLACVLVGFLLGQGLNDAHSESSYRRQMMATPTYLKTPQISTEKKPPVRDVHVGSMCRCPSRALAVPGTMSAEGRDTHVVQHPSKATGGEAKHFFMHPPREGEGCSCLEDHPHAEATNDETLSTLQSRCPAEIMEQNGVTPTYSWEAMPDFGVEEKLPLFVGVLSYESPLSLNSSLHNWRDHRLFERSNSQDVFVQLNHRSDLDDQVLSEYNDQLMNEDHRPPVTVMGSPEDNFHPGLAISRMCRAAESHPNSHPNGENLLMFLEKDWHYRPEVRNPEEIFNSINSLAQRGVNYIRLSPPLRPTRNNPKTWNCPAQGVPWMCSTAHHHRWSNQPMVISCNWFLRYLEPFALLDDPIMYGCRPGFIKNGYSDWEEVMMDGRVAWTDSQWTVAHVPDRSMKLFQHNEVDQ